MYVVADGLVRINAVGEIFTAVQIVTSPHNP